MEFLLEKLFRDDDLEGRSRTRVVPRTSVEERKAAWAAFGAAVRAAQATLSRRPKQKKTQATLNADFNV